MITEFLSTVYSYCNGWVLVGAIVVIVLASIYAFWHSLDHSLQILLKQNKLSKRFAKNFRDLKLFDLIILSFVFALVFSRGIHFLTHLNEIKDSCLFWIPYEKINNQIYYFRCFPWKFFKIWDKGISIPGFVLGFFLFIYSSIYIYKIPWSVIFRPVGNFLLVLLVGTVSLLAIWTQDVKFFYMVLGGIGLIVIREFLRLDFIRFKYKETVFYLFSLLSTIFAFLGFPVIIWLESSQKFNFAALTIYNIIHLLIIGVGGWLLLAGILPELITILERMRRKQIMLKRRIARHKKGFMPGKELVKEGGEGDRRLGQSKISGENKNTKVTKMSVQESLFKELPNFEKVQYTGVPEYTAMQETSQRSQKGINKKRSNGQIPQDGFNQHKTDNQLRFISNKKRSALQKTRRAQQRRLRSAKGTRQRKNKHRQNAPMSRSFAMSYKDFDKGWSKVPRKIIRWLFPRKRPDNQESMDKSVGKEAVSDKFTRKSKDKSVKNVEEKLVGKSKEKLIKKTNDQLPQRSKNKSVKKKNPKSTQKSNDQPEISSLETIQNDES